MCFCCFQCVNCVTGNKSLQKMWCTSATQCRLIELQYLKDWFTFLSCSLIHISSFPCSFPFSCSAVHQLFFFSVFQTDFSNKKRFWSKNKGNDFLPASKPAGEMITARKIFFNTCSVPYLCLKTEMNSANLSFKLCWLQLAHPGLLA